MSRKKISATPWNSIAESIVDFEPIQLTHAEALASPCATCSTAPCCTHLPLHTFKITNMIELDHALYLLNFERIELALSASGEWSVYYTYPCRFLDRKSFKCTVHNTPQQPQICVHYNPYQCWYKRVLTQSISEDFIRIDRQRMEFILPHIVFDEARNITQVPSWEFLTQEIAKLPLKPNPHASEPPAADPVMESWKEMIINPNGDSPAAVEAPQSYESLNNPCSGCQAYCCHTLVFPQSPPGHISNLDYLRFCLGFPGIELGIADDSWSIVVKTTCRHLQDNRCTIYGQPERPLICKYYDAWKCTYKPHFGLPRPNGFLRVKLGQFEWLSECFEFDESGTITQLPPTEVIRTYIEEKWRSEPIEATEKESTELILAATTP